MSTITLARELHDRRLRAVDEFRALIRGVESRKRGVWSAEDEQKSDRLNTDIDTLGKRIDELLQIQQINHDLDEQRARFEKVVRPDGDGRRYDDEFPDGLVAAALRGEGPKVFEADFRRLKHTIEPDGRLTVETRDLSKLTDAAGKFTVPQDFLEELFRHLVENAGVRAAGARQITTDTGQDMPVPKTTTHGAAAAVAENAPIPESDPAFGRATLGAWKFGMLIQVSNELATDSGIGLDSYLAEAAGSNLGLASGNEYVLGDGTTEPDGVAVSPSVGKTGATGQTLTVIGDDLIDLFHSIVTGYRTAASWLMRDASLAVVRKIKTGESGSVQYLWQPGLVAGAPDTILGRPVITDPSMPAMAANAYSILFGDFARHYVIRDVVGVRFERSDDYAFATDQITFRALLRTDGKRVDLNAVKAYRNSAT